MALVRFADPRFRGGRFEGNGLPVDVLPELSAYREAIIALAKSLFLQRNMGRQRVPRGFVDSFRLVLRHVEEGSAVPVLERVEPDISPALLFGGDYFTVARDRIADAVQAASTGNPLPGDFPASVIPQFNQFGKSLRAGEYIELHDPGRSIGPRYDRDTRRQIILQYKPEYEAAIDITAELRGGVLDRGATFLLSDGALIDLTLPEPVVEQLLPMVRSQIRFIGSGMFDQNDRLKSIVSIEELSTPGDEIPVPMPLDVRIAQLSVLQNGWYTESSPALEQSLLESVRDLVSNIIATGDIPSPFIYPTPKGNVQIEWSFPFWEVSFVVTANASVLIHATHLESDRGRDLEIDMHDDEAIPTLRELLLECAQ